ncbi:unnamed protein product, partial [Symbiodinium pilosum]
VPAKDLVLRAQASRSDGDMLCQAGLKIANASANHEEDTVYKALVQTELIVNIPWTYLNLGTGVLKSEPVLADFWHHFMISEPDHPIVDDIQSGRVDPSYLIPINLHGDGGRTFKKAEIMILQWQSCIGKGTQLSHSRRQKRQLGADVTPGQVNLCGHSLSTRFLISVLRKKFYMEDATPLLDLLGHVSDWFGSLYKDGLLLDGQLWRFLPLGLKGDLVFQSKAASLTRSFAHVRKRAATAKSKDLVGCCSWCLAGTSEVAFEDFGVERPAWLATAGENNPLPWTSMPSLLRNIPHAPDAHSFLKIDLFHTLNMGVYKEYAASSLCLCLALPGKKNQ